MKEDEDNKLKRVIVRGVAAIVRSVIIMIIIINDYYCDYWDVRPVIKMMMKMINNIHILQTGLNNIVLVLMMVIMEIMTRLSFQDGHFGVEKLWCRVSSQLKKS